MSSLDWVVRDPAVVAALQTDSCLFIIPNRDPLILSDVDVDSLGRALAATSTPISRAELAASLEEDAIRLLLDEGVLVAGSEAELRARLAGPPRLAATDRPCRRVTFAISGAISSLNAYSYVLSVARALAESVDVIITRAAQRFIQPRVFRYFGLRTWTDPYEARREAPVPHMYLAGADLVVVSPCSAATLQRLATGACDDLLSLVVTATEAPVVLAPVMNVRMWRNPAVARNVAQLRADGIWVVEPRAGHPVSDADAPAEQGRLGYDADSVLKALLTVLHARRA
jgi:hypothetical protein